jgi:hypothetical protein
LLVTVDATLIVDAAYIAECLCFVGVFQ